tara:strand:+ start:249 stop:413 length:165 start_codon:yes stop_codon:yes gene_type:complete
METFEIIALFGMIVSTLLLRYIQYVNNKIGFISAKLIELEKYSLKKSKKIKKNK